MTYANENKLKNKANIYPNTVCLKKRYLYS